MKKRLIIGLILFLLLSTYNIQETFRFGSDLKINEIIVENNEIISHQEIKKKLMFLYERNLFFLNMNNIKINLKEIDFIKSFEIKKIYPNKIKIRVFEKKPKFIIQTKKSKKYFTADGTSIKYLNLKKFENLPVVFGDAKNFKRFLNDLKIVNFPVEKLKKFYFFDSKRWDVVTNKNQLIKLPIIGYKESLKKFIYLSDQESFKKFKVFDFRIKDQLILK